MKSSICTCAYVPVSRKDRATAVVHIVPVDHLFPGIGAYPPLVNMEELMTDTVLIHESAKMEDALREFSRTGR